MKKLDLQIKEPEYFDTQKKTLRFNLPNTYEIFKNLEAYKIITISRHIYSSTPYR